MSIYVYCTCIKSCVFLNQLCHSWRALHTWLVLLIPYWYTQNIASAILLILLIRLVAYILWQLFSNTSVVNTVTSGVLLKMWIYVSIFHSFWICAYFHRYYYNAQTWNFSPQFINFRQSISLSCLHTRYALSDLSEFSERGATRRHFSRQVAQLFRRKFRR
jgi:hypothetical protein